MAIDMYGVSYTGTTGSSGTDNLKIQESSELDMQDFLDLMVAQLTNQDPMNPMDNTEFISQMAQFSSLEAMSEIRETSLQAQATSLIGKDVVVASYNSRGQLITDEGTVQKVTIYGGETKIYVNDEAYDYSNVMEVKDTQSTVPEEEESGDESNGEDSEPSQP